MADDEHDADSQRHARRDPADGARAAANELRNLLRQLTTPVVESLDARLRDQVAGHVDEAVAEKVEAALRDRLSLVDRAIADLSRSVEALDRRVAALERHGEPEELEG